MPQHERALFAQTEATALPVDYHPARPEGFDAARIVLAKGSQSTEARRRFVESICALYPSSPVIECPDLPHNRVDLGEPDPLARHREGKRTLVFGEHNSAVRLSRESGNTCPNYRHYSVYGYCFYGCSYCYLAGTHGVWASPTVRIYVNLPEILAQVHRTAESIGRTTGFYLGKLQDGLALDPLSGYSTVLVPFFAQHTFARQVILTKSASIDRLLPLEHRGHTILSWSLNPPEIAAQFERNVPPVEARIEAMRMAAKAGYPVRAVIMPLIPVPGWEHSYSEFLQDLLDRVPVSRLTFGGICSYANARRLMEHRLGRTNAVSAHLAALQGGDGRARYSGALRSHMHLRLARIAREVRPDLGLALCLEDPAVWQAVHAHATLGPCNCIL